MPGLQCNIGRFNWRIPVRVGPEIALTADERIELLRLLRSKRGRVDEAWHKYNCCH